MIRLKDIAGRAGVSVMTVSKALRDAPDVSAETKTRIKLLAQQLGYVPDSSAQGLRTRTTKLLGLAVPSSADPLLSRVVLAIEQSAYEMGYDVLLAHTLNIPEREDACVRRFLSRRVDGFFISPAQRGSSEPGIFQEVTARGIPTIVLGPAEGHMAQFHSVQWDETLATCSAVQHLLKLGHKRVAFLAGPRGAPSALRRFDGYRKALRASGLDVDDTLVYQAGHLAEDGANAAHQMLSEKCGATAVQAVNDLVALGAMGVFLKAGLGVPADISISGFGNVLPSEHAQVPLTTCRQPKYRLGVAAAHAMQHLLRGKQPEVANLTAELIVRASTGTPRAPV